MIHFIYSTDRFQSKPDPEIISFYLQKTYHYAHEDCDIERIAELIGEGRAWRAGIYDEHPKDFKIANVRAAQILALDFDACPHSPEEVVDYAKSIGLPPSLWYYSYSQDKKPHNNFRVLWVLEEPISPNQYKNIYPVLLDTFAGFQPDKSTKDASRLWFGTTRPPSIVSTTPISLGSLGWLGVMEKMKAGVPANKAKGKKLCGTNYFDMPKPDAVTVGKGWYERLRVRCWLWDKWEKGEYLDYNQRLTLFTNLRYLRYGDTSQSVLRDVLGFYDDDTYKDHSCDEAQITSQFRSSSLVPLPIVLDDDDYITVPHFFQDQKEKISFVNTERIPLAELDKLMDEQMPKLLSSEEIIYIEAQTSAGKSERVIQWLLIQDLSQKKIIYSVPKHSNGKEFYERMAKHQAMDNVWLIPKGTYSKEDLLRMEIGLSARTPQNERFSVIRRMVHPATTGLFIATHQLLAHTEEINADYIIIDENIEEALVDTVRCGVADMYALLAFMPRKSDREALCAFIEEVESLGRNQPIDISPLRDPLLSDRFDWEAYAMSNVRKIAGLGKIRYMDTDPKTSIYEGSPCVRFVARSKLYDIAIHKQIPVKMMSATPRTARLYSLYNADIRIHTFPLAENAGRVIQYLGTTGAKGNKDCDKVPALIDYVKKKLTQEEINNSWVISFMGAVDMWEDAGFRVPTFDGDPIHPHNNSGLDFLKGENVIVAGKFDLNDEYYTDIYYDMYPDATEAPVKITRLETINGKAVRMFLWADEQLRNIQLENIRLTAEQSCGRARSLREGGSTVYLFLNYPVRDADEYRD